MSNSVLRRPLVRRSFLRGLVSTVFGALAGRSLIGGAGIAGAQTDRPVYLPVVYPSRTSSLYVARDVPVPTFPGGDNHHPGVDSLLALLGQQGVKFHQSSNTGPMAGPDGIIGANDIVLIKVNAQWKYRGCTNSDVVRGIIQRILDHPDAGGFKGEVVIFENGQGRGRLNCDNGSESGYADTSVQANAENPRQSFTSLVNDVFKDPRVSSFLLDGVAGTLVNDTDHTHNGYRRLNPHPERQQWYISYPCFTTIGGHRVELARGVWNSTTQSYDQNLKLINVPVLKTHGGCGVTGALKLFYGVLSMQFNGGGGYHYQNIGTVLGEMMAHVKAPDLNIMDCIWICFDALGGYPASTTSRQNMLLAGLDPVALDYWASKNIMYAHHHDPNHNPDDPAHYTDSNLSQYLDQAVAEINSCGGIGGRPTTRNHSLIATYSV